MATEMNRRVLPEEIQTERLVLRPYGFEDVEDVYAYAADKQWAQYLPVPDPYSRDDAIEFLARQVLLDRVVHPTWAITLDDSVVGGINIRFNFENLIGEMGYSIARGLWGRGLVTEAAKAVLDTAFATHSDLQRVRAMADARNLASQRVMEKIGMQREGLLRRNRLHRGELVDEVWFGVLREEWEQGRARMLSQ